MSSRPLVSCIIPVFNGARFLTEAVESIEAQSYRPIEIIVVDDGSTDSTDEVIAGLGERVRSVRQENRGPAAARNRGIAIASGAFIALLDVDDLWLPEKLELQMARFDADPDISLCTTQAEHFWELEVAEEADALRDELDAPRDTGWLNSAVVKRDLFDRIGMLDEDLFHLDALDFLMRAQEAGAKLEVLPQHSVRRRLHGSNMSRNRDGEAEERMRLIQARLQRARSPQPS